MTRRIVAIVAGAILTPLFMVQAQSISGVVREAVSGVPIAGAVVSLNGGGGTAVTQTIASREGRYTIAVPPQAQRIVVRRIGFRPFEAILPDSARTARVTLDVGMQLVPRTLDPVAASGEGCPPSKTVGQGFALWEQARSAFLATIVARSVAPATLLSLHYKVDAPDKTIVRDARGLITSTADAARGITRVAEARVEQLTSNRPVVAGRTPAEFAARGFLEVTGGLPDLYGPDADYLLDPGFEKGHCFSLAEQSDKRPGQVGVSFTPAAGRESVADIKGVLWMDQSPLAVRGLEFVYVGRGAAPRDRSGGRLSFRTADNGVVLIDEWELHYPAPTTRLSTVVGGGRDPVSGMTTTRVLSQSTTDRLYVVGGSLLAATWPDGSSLRREHASIEAKVVEAKTKTPVAGAYASLEDAGYAAQSAADGSFQFSPLVPGSYSIRVADSAWARYGIQRVGTASVNAFTPGTPSSPKEPITLPSALEAAQSRCNTSTLNKGKGIVAARAVDSTGQTVVATFVLDWFGTNGKDRAQLTTSTRGGIIRPGAPSIPRAGIVVCGIGAGTLTINATTMNEARGSIELRPIGAAGIDTVTIVVRR